RRMFDLLSDYPVYEPLHRQGPNFLRDQQGNQSAEERLQSVRAFVARGEENLAHLMAHRDERLTALRNFLLRFDVTLALDDPGLQAVSAWRPGNIGVLVANHRDHATRQAFFQHASWVGKWCGLNVIFDLGVFLGECVIARRPKLRWKYVGG